MSTTFVTHSTTLKDMFKKIGDEAVIILHITNSSLTAKDLNLLLLSRLVGFWDWRWKCHRSHLQKGFFSDWRSFCDTLGIALPPKWYYFSQRWQITQEIRKYSTDQQCVCESVLGTLFDEMEDVLREWISKALAECTHHNHEEGIQGYMHKSCYNSLYLFGARGMVKSKGRN